MNLSRNSLMTLLRFQLWIRPRTQFRPELVLVTIAAVLHPVPGASHELDFNQSGTRFLEKRN